MKKDNFIERKKKGIGDPKNLLYRFAYHDFYFLENKLKSKIKSMITNHSSKQINEKTMKIMKPMNNQRRSIENQPKIVRVKKTR